MLCQFLLRQHVTHFVLGDVVQQRATRQLLLIFFLLEIILLDEQLGFIKVLLQFINLAHQFFLLFQHRVKRYLQSASSSFGLVEFHLQLFRVFLIYLSLVLTQLSPTLHIIISLLQLT
jgi:hypothetical protein